MSKNNVDNFSHLLTTEDSGVRTEGGDEEGFLSSNQIGRRMSVDSKYSTNLEPEKTFNNQSDPAAIRQLSVSPLSFGTASPAPGTRHAAWLPEQQHLGGSTVLNRLHKVWRQNQGVILVACSQLFGALMNMSARLLELEGDGMHPFQVLFARQSLTTLAAVLYMWYYKTPGFPFGPKEIRWLLIARGFLGFFGIYGMWHSLMYLPLAEATVISFLAPSVAGFACYMAFGEPFTRKEQIGTLVAFVGVVLIAHPTALLSALLPGADSAPETTGNSTATAVDDDVPGFIHEATPAERLEAVGIGLIGVLGAAGAFTTIRWIGKRAHPLISVNYFSTWCTIVSLVVLSTAPSLDIAQPGLRFALPQGIKQWLLLIFLGIMGFTMQFILTTGLSIDRSNRANAMVFTHMLFAAGFDKWIFGQSMGWVSLAGCGLIIGSALYMVLTKNETAPKREDDVEIAGGGVGIRDTEAVPMLMRIDHGDDEYVELESRRTPLGG